MKIVAVTTCSLSHLAQAKGMADSLVKYNPEYIVLIGLTDELNGRIPPSYYAPHELVEARRLGISEYGQMRERYTPLELNCALKSFFCDYALKNHHADAVVFFDSDILIFHSLQFLEEQLQQASILLTPHITKPYPDDGHRPKEREMLKNGIFNAGFFAFKNNANGLDFLDWLKLRMLNQCYVNAKEGLNADQTWFNLVPLFFKNVMILDHPGCNAAYWNLHERTITKKVDSYIVNETFPLLFFHFSGYSLHYPQQLSRHQDRTVLKDSSVLYELLKQYHDTLIKNKSPLLLSKKAGFVKIGFWCKLKKLFNSYSSK